MSDVSRSVLLARVADRTLRWRFLSWYWGDAIAADGLLAAETGDGSYRDHVAECLSQWAGTPGSFDDALVPGRAALRLSAAGYLDAAVADRIRSMLDRMAYIAPGVPMLEPHRPVYRFGVCIDAIYHLPVMLAAAGNYYDEPALRQRAIDTALHTLDVLRCDTGWAQWYDAAHDRNNGIAWSRGLGWALLGLLDLVDELDDQGCDAVRERAAQILSSLATAQSGNGHWPVVLYDSTTDNSQTPTETSTAAFFVAAAHHPAAELNAAAVPVLERATEAVLAAVDADGVYQGVSADVLPTWDIADYLRFAVEPSPWGQGRRPARAGRTRGQCGSHFGVTSPVDHREHSRRSCRVCGSARRRQRATTTHRRRSFVTLCARHAGQRRAQRHRRSCRRMSSGCRTPRR